MQSNSAIRVVLILLALLAPAAACAHASLVFAHPGDGALLAQPPSALRLRFNEAVRPLVARIIDPAGKIHDDAATSAQDETVEITPREKLRDGTYTLSWRVISADGHPVGGSLSFSIGRTSGGSAAVASDSIGRAVAIWFFQTLFYVSLLFAIGAAVYFGWFTPASRFGPGRLRILALFSSFVIAAAASLALQGLDMGDLGAAALMTAAPWREALGSPFGATVLFALAAAALAAVALLSPAALLNKGLVVGALVCLGAAAAVSGHANVATVTWLTRPAVAAHVVAAALLIGPMAVLAGAFGESGAWFRDAMRRSKAIAYAALAVVLAGGVALAVVEIGRVSALFTTPYGQVLLAKLAAVTGAVLLALRSRRTRDVGARKSSSRRFLRIELALVVCALGLTALWRFTPPPRAAANVERTLHIHTDRMMAMASFKPGRVGSNRVRIELMTGDFGSLEAKEVTLTATPENRSIEPIEQRASLSADVRWTIADLRVPFAGAWRVEVAALVTDFDKIEISDTFVFDP